MGIAQRTSRIKFAIKPITRKQFKPLPLNVQTISGAIRAARQAKNLTLGYVAAKMGIAAVLISAWEDGSSIPNDWQLQRMDEILQSCLAVMVKGGTPSKLASKMLG